MASPGTVPVTATAEDTECKAVGVGTETGGTTPTPTPTTTPSVSAPAADTTAPAPATTGTPSSSTASTDAPRKPRRFVGRRKGAGAKARPKRAAHKIPDEILNDPELTAAINLLPSNYNFEVRKTVWKLKEAKANCVALQFPEGLLLFACTLADIFEKFTGATVLILGDVTYGACCVGDLTAAQMGCDFLVHYAHSCLVPIDVTSIKVLYVFVDIGIDVAHAVDMVKANFEATQKLSILGTIQFAAAIHQMKAALPTWDITVPRATPLSRSETLGCTSPKLGKDIEALIFVADGRFHLEAAMIANPHVKHFRYNPYDKRLTKESYALPKMIEIRKEAIQTASKGKTFCLCLGTLGRQGNPRILERLETALKAAGKDWMVLLISEIFPAKLALFKVDAFIQIACPRLSIDWGTFFEKPVLNPFEAFVMLGQAKLEDSYPMDFYAKGSGPWTNYYTEVKIDSK